MQGCRNVNMTTTKTIRDLKVGDTVFVVHQKKRTEKEHRTEERTVIKVGRQYAYLAGGYYDMQFSRETGQSVHLKDCNARNNGYGFDVYLSRGDWEKLVADTDAKQRLQKRLVKSYGTLVDLPPEVVGRIHAILDDAEVAPCQST